MTVAGTPDELQPTLDRDATPPAAAGDASPSSASSNTNHRGDTAMPEVETRRTESMPRPAPAASPATNVAGRTLTLSVEHVSWSLLLLVAAGLRLIALDATPLRQAEGIGALQSWQASKLAAPAEWPGSLSGALTALLFRLFGAGDAAARIVPALAGVALVASFLLLRPYLGRAVPFAGACLAAISPVLVFDARSADGQALGAATAIVLAWLMLGFIERPRPRPLVGICGLLAVGLTTDAVFLGMALLLAIWLALRWTSGDDADLAAAWRVVRHTEGWLLPALPLAAAGLLLATTRFGLGFARLRPAAIASWSLAFTPQRADVPWHYALDVLAGYELPLTLLALAGGWWVLSRATWRTQPALGLLFVWACGGLLLNLFMAGRQPCTLLLAVVPACLLGGVAIERVVHRLARGSAAQIDLLLAAGLFASVTFVLAQTLAYLHTPALGVPRELWLGLLLGAVCVAGVVYRVALDGFGAALPAAVVVSLACLVFEVHGAAAAGFGSGDEFLAGQRTTAEGAAIARLLVLNGGGVSTVTDDARLPLAWYLRDTVSSGGHGGARLIAHGQAPAGYYVAAQETLIAQSWTPRSFDAQRMLGWLMYRTSWGRTIDVNGLLVVAQ